MQATLDGLVGQLEKYKIESELIFVDWNPPQDKPRLKEALKWPKGAKYCTIRVIEVPPAVHQRMPYWEKLPIYVVGAINCGIRRARGQFVLPRPIDLLYSDELISFIAAKKLKENERYRVNRCDVNRAVLEKNGLKGQLEYCKDKNSILKVHRHDPNYRQEGLPSMHTDASGDFQLMSRNFWHLLHGYREQGDIISAYADPLMSYASYAAGVKEVILPDECCIYHIDHDSSFNQGTKIKRSLPEKALMLFYRPLRSVVPPSVTSKMMFWYQEVLGNKRKTEVFGIPTMDYMEYIGLSRSIVSEERSYVINGDDWGLGNESFKEFVINTASWDKNK